jgi:asparagine synthetase B (glutamine-hydrolysing)
MIYKNDIIPRNQIRTGVMDELDHEAICVFIALGYFLEDKTFYKGLKTHLPGTITDTDASGNILSSNPWFKWHYSPRDITFEQALDEFTVLFEKIIAEQGENGYTIPISGGLDSRTLVAAAGGTGKSIKGYSYAFRNGHDETLYGKKMADEMGFKFESWHVPKGSLWSYIEPLAKRNGCYAEFTNPRQYAFYDELKKMGGTFLLGHGGDLYFDDMGVDEYVADEVLLDTLWSRLVKKSGLELATRMWKEWGLTGNFTDHLRAELGRCLFSIDIKEANPKLRAFKSLFYVPRWTCANLEIFQDFGPNLIPYFDNRMCEFICTVPEKWLSGRKLQIEYLKRRSPALARITWQSHKPFNLYNYEWDRVPFNLPYRFINKIKRILSKDPTIQRNWELQFLGDENEAHLEKNLLNDPSFHELIPRHIAKEFYQKFKSENQLTYYNSTTMMLTLSMFQQLRAEVNG